MRILALAAITLLLAGCVPADPRVTPVPIPSSTPLFANDADALAAATDAFTEYLRVSDQILQDGGAQPERILGVTTARVGKVETAGFKKFKASGYRGTGSTTFSKASLERFDSNSPDGQSVVAIYICVDVSGTDVLNPSGQSVISPTRPSESPFEIQFEHERMSQKLIVSSNEIWSGENFCE